MSSACYTHPTAYHLRDRESLRIPESCLPFKHNSKARSRTVPPESALRGVASVTKLSRSSMTSQHLILEVLLRGRSANRCLCAFPRVLPQFDGCVSSHTGVSPFRPCGNITPTKPLLSSQLWNLYPTRSMLSTPYIDVTSKLQATSISALALEQARYRGWAETCIAITMLESNPFYRKLVRIRSIALFIQDSAEQSHRNMYGEAHTGPSQRGQLSFFY